MTEPFRGLALFIGHILKVMLCNWPWPLPYVSFPIHLHCLIIQW